MGGSGGDHRPRSLPLAAGQMTPEVDDSAPQMPEVVESLALLGDQPLTDVTREHR